MDRVPEEKGYHRIDAQRLLIISDTVAIEYDMAAEEYNFMPPKYAVVYLLKGRI